MVTWLDALVPGIVRERSRAIWQLQAIRILDGGADEDADTLGDNNLFAVPGLFVP